MRTKLEIVRKRDAHAFEILPRRWSSSAPWPGSAHTAAAPVTTSYPESHEAMILWAMTALMVQRLAANELQPD